MDLAVLYEQSVRRAFADEPQKLEEFLKLLTEIRENGIENANVAIERIPELVKANRDLFLGFKQLYPEAEINIPPEFDGTMLPDSDESNTTSETFAFLRKIKTRFEGSDNDVYWRFLNILRMYKKREKSCEEVYKEVFELFENHEDLAVAFRRFEPKF